MIRWTCVLLSLAGATAANAASLRIYFSTTGLNNGVLAAPPPESVAQVNPTVAAGTNVFLYGQVVDAGSWNQIALNYTGADGAVTLDNSAPGGGHRWSTDSDLNGRLNGTDPTNVFGGILSNPYSLDALDNLAITAGDGSVHFYLGFSTTTAPGSVFLHVGQQGILRGGGNPLTDNIFFGWNDAAVRGNDFGRASDSADLTITPEPTTGALCLAGVLLLVRRH